MKLDIGSGVHYQKPLEEWTHLNESPADHVEIVCDWKTIPLPTESVDEIHIGDVVEHIPRWEYAAVLGEWNRVLKVGGIFHGSTPDLHRTMMDYAQPGPHHVSLQDAINALYGWATSTGQQHYTTYTKETLTDLLSQYGFQIDDFSGSPGPVDRPWWLVFRGRKVSRTIWRPYGN